jgi:predicted DNA-binding protein
LADLEDLEDLYLAEKRIAKVSNSKSKTSSLNAVEQEIGMAN